ncbi:MAG: succinate dehydrogenase, hydrophobic membrane anchor protein [Alphaproteobacteria bacterium]|jgi:succinate dehydrogenase / fumarate reductase membrane anchor subunit|nr:succinate dehydrogenase, hydrophobic membrane anchor protein [Alphaproteobacteria bacterium]
MALDAVKHWKVLRLTAIAAIPLCIWFILNILGLIGAPYEVFRAWLQSPVNAVFMIALIVVTFYHGMLGVHEILEDYVHAPGILKASMTAKCIAFVIVGAISVLAVVKVAFL